MVEPPISRIEWIQFLNGKANRILTYVVGCVSIVIGLITLSVVVWAFQANVLSLSISLIELIETYGNSDINIPNPNMLLYALEILKYLLIVYAIFVGIMGIYFSKYNSEGAKAKRLLDKIMIDEIGKDEIKTEWLKKEEHKMMKRILNEKNAYGLIILGGITLVSGIILSFIYCDEINLCNLGKYLITISIGVISIGIAILSYTLGKKSDEKMKAIANVNFLQIVIQIEDARIGYLYYKWSVELFIWRTFSLVEMAYELLKKDKQKKFIEKKHKERLVNYFNTSLKELFKKITWKELEPNQRGNIIATYDLIKNEYHKKGITDFKEIKKKYLKEDSKKFA